MDKKIYMDHAATTYVKPEVLEEMMPYFTSKFGNPSGIYYYSREAKEAIELARERVAKAIGADVSEIFFTSGGTEADNWAIKGIAFAQQKRGDHIITSQIEHHAVLHPCEYLEKLGFKVTYLPVDQYGSVDPDDVRKAITDKTVLISIMMANNEVGTIEPIEDIGKIAAEKGVYFHTDAVQAVGNIPIDVKKLNVDMLSISGHKFYGPKGTGVLYIKKGVKIDPFMHGGAQERNRRASTENVPGIVGLGKAIELSVAEIEKRQKHLTYLRDKLIKGVMERVSYVRLNGHPKNRLPGNVNFSFEFVEGESILLSLDLKGVAASSGSACTSGSLDPSHVLLAMGLPHEIAHGSLRLTLGDDNTEEDIDYVLNILPDIIDRLRQMSPLFAERKGVLKNV